MENYQKVANLSEFTSEEGLPIKVNNLCLALFKLKDGEVYAIENSCPHVGAPLHNGLIEDKKVTCLWHGWCFDLASGDSTNCPGVKIKSFPVKVVKDEVWVAV
ncbi:MAG: Rieske 2Fe-2S domain-containing protein [Candidatus Caenarcaniphilales bacterium]|nr:Rieske 2Fe-2S domain-containing protein [Candidatus Caenarcaniphilales bacterium]